jgi:hypothetical protein
MKHDPSYKQLEVNKTWALHKQLEVKTKLVEGSCLIYLQLFVGGIMFHLPPVVCRRVHVLFTSSCLWEGSCLIYLQLFVEGLISYLPPAVCERAHVLFTLFVFAINVREYRKDNQKDQSRKTGNIGYTGRTKTQHNTEKLAT